jgi:hypothetical protein
MEQVKRAFVLFLFICFVNGKAQDIIPRKGLIKGMATISPAKMFGYKESYFYLHGNLEGYLSEKVSVSGDAYMFLGEQTKSPEGFKYINNVFFGLNYHFLKGNGDLYMGLQPGVCIAQLKAESPKVTEAHVGTSPVFSSILGYNYFVGKYFNFFIQARYIAGSHNYDLHKSLSEIRFSAGLGFNINTIKKKD